MGMVRFLSILSILILPTFAAATSQAAAPLIQLKDVQGNTHNITRYSDKLTLIHFWASWCTPCLREIPELLKLQQQLAPAGLNLIMIAADNRSAVRDYLREHQYEFTVLLDQYGRAMKDFAVTGLPATYVIDRNGDVVAGLKGETDWKSQKALLLRLLN